ncbi:hypothetical protein PVAND_011887 [Polypedilum vanderplanki]|uniref:MD-2-related lipid-recognition domain-containing protein n=1 Tax=Polypedilum vanderplanki TaxID=319348 RepID=A0A9J6CKN2_POLVA|nr:hypothetical protein PVAND_011887 [Polypedilum vanderplanki]
MTEGRAIRGKNNEINFDGVKIKKLNKTNFALSGSMDVTVEIDDTFELECNLYKKQGNEYKLTPFHIGPYKFCDYIQNKALAYDEILECSDLPQRKDCPWKKEKYTFNKCLIPTNKVPKFLDGEYRVDVTLWKNKESAGGYQIFFYVISFVG